MKHLSPAEIETMRLASQKGNALAVTRADELDALAERVEKLTGSDREVDVRIHFALNPDQRIMTDSGSIRPPKHDASYCLLHEFNLDTWEDWDGLSIIVGAKPVTSSLDAAMSLLGDNAIEQFTWWPRAPQEHQSEICCRVRLIGLRPDGWGDSTRKAEAKGTTPALALTAACLRAQASIIREAGR